MKIGDIIKNARENAGMTQQELAEKVGYKSFTTIAKIESGARDLRLKKAVPFANALGIDPMLLLKHYDVHTMQKTESIKLNQIPLVGKIACGSPILATQTQGDFYFTDESTHADFCLIAHGDSMKDIGITDGDLIFCRSQNSVENGEVAAVLIEDGAEYSEATLKRVFFYPEQNRLILIPENPDFPALTFSGDNLKKVRIIGKALVCQSKIK